MDVQKVCNSIKPIIFFFKKKEFFDKFFTNFIHLLLQKNNKFFGKEKKSINIFYAYVYNFQTS